MVNRGKGWTAPIFGIPYDRLLIATGARPIMPELPGFDLEGVMALKSLADGRRIKSFYQVSGCKKGGHNRDGVYRARDERGLKGARD